MAKKKVELTREEMIDLLCNDIKKHQKREVVVRASEVYAPHMLRRPTLVADLDLAIGGGLPCGGITQIKGKDGAGKNALCYQIIGACQRTYQEDSAIAWCWLETPLDKRHAQLNGAFIPMSDEEIRQENLYRKNSDMGPLTKDQVRLLKRSRGLFMVVDQGNSSEKLDAIAELVQSNLFQIVVVDSIAAVLTKAREGTDLYDDPQQSSEARLLTEFQKKIWGAYSSPDIGKTNQTVLIVINQVRDNRSTNPGAPKTKSGGPWAIKHAKLLDIEISQGRRVYQTKTGKHTYAFKKDAGYEHVGKDVMWKVTKGKAGCHEGGQGEVIYFYKSGFNIYRNLVGACVSLGFITTHESKKQGDWFEIMKPGGELVTMEGGLAEAEQLVGTEDKLFDFLYHQVLISSKVPYLHKDEDEKPIEGDK